ncbi:MAG: EAL domain-containing protein [Pseudomonadota bacterium]
MTLFAGMIAHVLVCLLIFFKLKDPVYLLFGSAIFANWLARAYSMIVFDKADISVNDRATIAWWERISVAGAAMIAFLLGTMSGYAFLVSQDAFAQIASVSVTISLLVSVVGRNFGTKITVNVVTLAACGPIMVSLLLTNDIYMTLIALLIVPLVSTTISMANGVREFVYENVLSRREIAIIADRFNTALNNMPHGLFMLNEQGRILVANRKAAELLAVPNRETLNNHRLEAVLRYSVRRGGVSVDRAKIIRRHLERLIDGGESRALMQFSDDLYLEFSARRRKNKGVVLIFEDVSSRILAEEKIVHMARYDSLSGLPNRSYFSELVDDHVRFLPDAERFALAVLNLDDFKHVNDTNGHLTGDRLLCAIARRLSGIAGDQMIVSRFGGDEFVVFLKDVEDGAHVDALMAEIFESVRGTYLINGSKLFVGLSAGVAIGSKAEFALDDLHIKADLALHETKQNDKNRWVIFADEMDEKYRRRQELKSALRDAVREKHFNIVYQPMFTLDATHVSCCEALSRWYHPEFGAVSPSVYIPLAEEMGIVGDLTRHMLDAACKDCASWCNGVSVSVNLSANDLRNQDIVSTIAEALASAGLDARRLQIEVTESAFVQDAAKAKTILQELRAMGVTIAIDDFGTGYSSLSYLNVLPLNKIKIDRSFVSDITSDARTLKLLKGVVNLSRELGLEIVVEGVESEEQLELIRSTNSADLVQGFIFGMPVPSSAISELISVVSHGGTNRLAVR